MIPLCLRTARSNGHSDTFSSNFFSKPLGILDTEGKNNNNKSNGLGCKIRGHFVWCILYADYIIQLPQTLVAVQIAEYVDFSNDYITALDLQL